jgi:uncharacterized protein with PIN domain
MVTLEEATDEAPVCPHCDSELAKVRMQELRGVLGRRYIYYCSACRKVLGISHRKGFWMG